MITKRLASFTIIILILITGCVASKDYHVDQNLVNQSHLFKSLQAPSFTMKLSDDFKYLGQADISKNDSDHSYRYFIHYFFNEKQKFAVSIQMITLNTGEWNVYRPWTWDLGKEIHGNKPFYCGSSMFNLQLTKKEKEIYSSYDISNGTKVTCKSWIYTPGGIRGGSRIIIKYFEQGDKTDEMSSFIKRADNNISFKMGDKAFTTKENPFVADEILKLKKLKDQGAISAEEYNQQKIKLLDQ